MQDLSKKITLCFATVSRPHCVQRLIKSIRLLHPEIPIIVAEQCDGESPLKQFYLSNNVRSVTLPSDAGVARARNAAVALVETDYILLADDDFIIGPELNLSAPLRILDSTNSVDILGGCLYDVYGDLDFSNFYVRRWERLFTLDDRSKTLISIAIDDISPIKLGTDAQPYFHCDAVMNWAVMRTNIFTRGARWDERFICNGEHEDFYLNLKFNTDIRVAYLPSLIAYHHHPHDNQYSSQRNRQEGWRLLGQKWNIEHYFNSPVGFHLLTQGEAIHTRSSTLEEFLSRARILPAPSYVSASFGEGSTIAVRGPSSAGSVNALLSNRGNVHFLKKKSDANSPKWPVTEFNLDTLMDVKSLSIEILTQNKHIEACVGDQLTIPVITRASPPNKIGVRKAKHRIALGVKVKRHSTGENLELTHESLTSMINDIDECAFQYANLGVDLPAGTYILEIDFWLDSVGWLYRSDSATLEVAEAKNH
jgi:glycosyltransferase involved in cell wall biosynthesis